MVSREITPFSWSPALTEVRPDKNEQIDREGRVCEFVYADRKLGHLAGSASMYQRQRVLQHHGRE